MQYAFNRGILVCHDSAPWSLTLMLLYPCSLSVKIYTSWARMLSKPFWVKILSNVTYHLHSFIHSALCSNRMLILVVIIVKRKTYIVAYLHLNELSSVISALIILSIICHLPQLCLYLSDITWCMWHIFHCAEDCGSEWPEKYAGLHTMQFVWM